MNVLSQGKVNLNDMLPTAFLARSICYWQWHLSSEKQNMPFISKKWGWLPLLLSFGIQQLKLSLKTGELVSVYGEKEFPMGVSVYLVLGVWSSEVARNLRCIAGSPHSQVCPVWKHIWKKLTVKTKLHTHIHSSKRTHRWEEFVFRISGSLLLAIAFIHT